MDVGRILWWIVVAWRQDFTGHIVSWGTHPDQKLLDFTNAGAKRTLLTAHPGMQAEGALTAGLDSLVNALAAQSFEQLGGSSMKIERIAIDANTPRDVIYSWLEKSPHSGLVVPSHGKGYGAKSQYLISDIRIEPGDRRGPGWVYWRGRGRQKTRHLLIDSNAAKSFIHRRLAAAKGDKGSLTIFQDKSGH